MKNKMAVVVILAAFALNAVAEMALSARSAILMEYETGRVLTRFPKIELLIFQSKQKINT